LLGRVEDSTTLGDFTIRSWTSLPARGERAVGVDQTNESVIVGDVAVVKRATHLQEGPHPAPLQWITSDAMLTRLSATTTPNCSDGGRSSKTPHVRRRSNDGTPHKGAWRARTSPI